MARLATLLLAMSLSTAASVGAQEFFTFEASREHVTPYQQIQLSWTSTGIDDVLINPIGRRIMNGNASTYVTVVNTTKFMIVSTENRSVYQELTVYADLPLAIDFFDASAGVVGSEDEVELSWRVIGDADISINGVGPLADHGTRLFSPSETTTYVLTATKDGYTETAELVVEVTDAWIESRFLLSFSDDQIITDAPLDFAPFYPIKVYVLGESLDGRGIAGVEFGLDLTPNLMIVDTDFYSYRAINVMPPPDYIVGLGLCIDTGPLHPLAEFTIMGMDDAAIADGNVKLRPASIPSVEGTVAYATCDIELNGSEINHPLTSALTGPPLYLAVDRVPIVSLALRAMRDEGIVRLQWDPVDAPAVDRIELARAVGGSDPRVIHTIHGGELSWVDMLPPSGSELRYELWAWSGSDLLAKAISKLPAEGEMPARSRLLAGSPNPFNPSTTLRWAASVPGDYELRIVNAAGRLIRDFHHGAVNVGEQETRWDGKDMSGRSAASGVYFVQLLAPDGMDQLRVVMLK